MQAVAAAQGLSLGAGAGIFVYGDQNAYEGRATRYLANLGGQTGSSRRADWAVIPVLTQGWRFSPYLGLELKERVWQTAVKGTFDASPELNYRLARTVVPLTLALALTGTNSESDAGVSITAGPGLYVIATDERGWFGSGSGTTARPGAHLTGGFFIRFFEQWYARADIGWDWFNLPKQNAFMDDGGPGGGITVTGGVEYRR